MNYNRHRINWFNGLSLHLTSVRIAKQFKFAENRFRKWLPVFYWNVFLNSVRTRTLLRGKYSSLISPIWRHSYTSNSLSWGSQVYKWSIPVFAHAISAVPVSLPVAVCSKFGRRLVSRSLWTLWTGVLERPIGTQLVKKFRSCGSRRFIAVFTRPTTGLSQAGSIQAAHHVF